MIRYKLTGVQGTIDGLDSDGWQRVAKSYNSESQAHTNKMSRPTHQKTSLTTTRTAREHHKNNRKENIMFNSHTETKKGATARHTSALRAQSLACG